MKALGLALAVLVLAVCELQAGGFFARVGGGVYVHGGASYYRTAPVVGYQPVYYRAPVVFRTPIYGSISTLWSPYLSRPIPNQSFVGPTVITFTSGPSIPVVPNPNTIRPVFTTTSLAIDPPTVRPRTGTIRTTDRNPTVQSGSGMKFQWKR